MGKLVLCFAATVLFATPAFAQMGGRGGGSMGSGVDEAPADDSDKARAIGESDRPHEIAPIPRDKFDKAVAAMFHTADANHDGMITLDELQKLIEARRDAIILTRFREIDANHDGRIDPAEFIAWQKALGSTAASDCSLYAGQGELVPVSIGPALGDNDRDDALALVIEPISALTIARANIHYRPGITLDDLLAYEDARFNAADTNHDGYLDQAEIDALRHRPGAAPGTHEGHHRGD